MLKISIGLGKNCGLQPVPMRKEPYGLCDPDGGKRSIGPQNGTPGQNKEGYTVWATEKWEDRGSLCAGNLEGSK